MIDLVYGPDSATFIMIHYVMLLYYVLNKHEYIHKRLRPNIANGYHYKGPRGSVRVRSTG